MLRKMVLPLLFWEGVLIFAHAQMDASMKPFTLKGDPVVRANEIVGGESASIWQLTSEAPALMFYPEEKLLSEEPSSLYVKIKFWDEGTGQIQVQAWDSRGSLINPEIFTESTLLNQKKWVVSYLKITNPKIVNDFTLHRGVQIKKIGQKESLMIAEVKCQEFPFEQPYFQYLEKASWKKLFEGPFATEKNNETMKGKVLCGYQGWFRTPNDPSNMGWIHWGDPNQGEFSVDMWPDLSEYPVSALVPFGNVKLKSGNRAMLFSSARPEVVDLHFSWMKKYNIDGVFLQRFLIGPRYPSRKAGEWVLGNVRAAANKENRVWAIEYDVSGVQDSDAYRLIEEDWKWLVDDFGLLKDPTYLHENGKPVVFIWGMAFKDRKFKVETSDKIIQFFKSDEKYGGNYLIGALPGDWRNLPGEWLAHAKKYDALQVWHSDHYREDREDFEKMGVAYLPMASPGFSWANLKKLPDLPIEYIPRRGGQKYWDEISRVAQMKFEALFVGMFDEYNEGTAIMPMSDDTPETPRAPGVIAKFYPGGKPQENPIIQSQPIPRCDLNYAPVAGVMPQDYTVKWEGLLVAPASGTYTMIIKGALEDEVTIFLLNSKVVDSQKITDELFPQATFSATEKGVPFRVEYRHFKEKGKVEFFWKLGSGKEESIPESAFVSAWGRFLTNEGKPSDWWMRLTGDAKEMINGSRPATGTMPGS
ncbi:MAG: PA14 domain-containing protein [Verrucomicrobiota bacterium]